VVGHVVRVARTNSSYAIQTAHAEGGALGLTTLRDQVRLFDPRPAPWWRP